MAKAIYFDMDGTIAGLYDVQDWLPKLRAFDPSPYAEAAPLLRLCTLARLLNKLQRNGYTLGIISWSSKNSTLEYDKAVAEAKREWLHRHLPSVAWDEIHITAYGVPKHETAEKPEGFLFDDNEGIRNGWTGTAYDVQNILEILKGL